MATEKQITALADAVWQVLDDMDGGGTCCCEAAKADLRLAYEPFADPIAPLRYTPISLLPVTAYAEFYIAGIRHPAGLYEIKYLGPVPDRIKPEF